MPSNEPENDTEAEYAEPMCSRCNLLEDDCECVYCESCDEYVDHGCDCRVCEHCEARFRDGQRGSCSECNYCANCINNCHVDHYTCPGCGSCRGEDSRSCDNCGEHECCVSFSCRQEDCYRCEGCCSCSNDDTSEYIRDYGCREYPDAKPRPRTVPASFLYLGVECETEADEEDNLKDIAESIHDKHSTEILMKEDGSLDHGIELVTGRYSLEAHKELWPELTKTAIKAGLRSWKHETTGLHVHMSRAFFTPLDIGKFLVFINSPNQTIREHIRKIAGRSANHYTQIKTKRFTDYHLSDDRYEALNLTNDRTIELRIFKGTLNATHILADIEFCHAVSYWVKQASIQEIENWHSFWAYVLKHKRIYRELVNFMMPVQTSMIEVSEDVLNKEVAA
jgi:putative amidoligase enzyme